ncbi:hypothetical protein HYN56_04875 [Flavobacterium crocinum]|uniref:Cell wall anchor protein n=1 Tax=Flavobacterium crocinum TaxID=2183896 RepID=A0A2S1YHR1_9FLAO|nr:hypothetical protein [Flavobacterium crocinum]AWK03589.1 hypothetical protein HYN56_04875 [Flavobacterium crocinum]
MKKYFKVMVMLGILGPLNIYAQVGMPTNNPNPNAVLDLNRTDGTSEKGLLLPKVALKATDNFAPMAAHVAGMKVYNTATDGSGETAVTPGEYNNDGTKWVRVVSKNETSDAWALGGNNNGAIKELGTKDAQPIPFITNGTTKMNLSTEGVLGLGGNSDVDSSILVPNNPSNPASAWYSRLNLMSDKNQQNPAIVLSTFTDDNTFASGFNSLYFLKGSGSHQNPKPAFDGDVLGQLKFYAYDNRYSTKFSLLTIIRASSFLDASGNKAGLLSLGNGGIATIYDSSVVFGNSNYFDQNQNKTQVFIAGKIGTNYKLQSSITGANISDVDQTSLYINTTNSTVTFNLAKAAASNNGRIATVVASGGTSSKVALKPATGDSIILMGTAPITTTTAAFISIKVISNGVDTWYQIP